MSTPFVPQKTLTAIAIGFSNKAFIADIVAPRVDVPTVDFQWTEFNSREMFKIPNTLIGRKGTANQVEFTATERSSFVEDYGLSDVVPNKDIMQAQGHPSINPINNVGAKLAELVALGREKRVADSVKDANNYNHKITLSGTDRWSDPNADIANQLKDALQAPRRRPNHLIVSMADAWNLQSNKSIAVAVRGNDQGAGLTPLSSIEQTYQLKIVIGEAEYDAANEGQDADFTQLWTGSAALLYIKPAAQLKDDFTFMLTAQWGGKVGSTRDVGVGLRGGKEVLIGESVREVLISKEAGYLFTNT